MELFDTEEFDIWYEVGLNDMGVSLRVGSRFSRDPLPQKRDVGFSLQSLTQMYHSF